MLYTIIRNESNENIYITDNFESMKKYVMKHFPYYTISEKYKMITLHSKNFTFNKIEMNYSLYDDEYYE